MTGSEQDGPHDHGPVAGHGRGADARPRPQADAEVRPQTNPDALPKQTQGRRRKHGRRLTRKCCCRQISLASQVDTGCSQQAWQCGCKWLSQASRARITGTRPRSAFPRWLILSLSADSISAVVWPVTGSPTEVSSAGSGTKIGS